MKKLCLCIVKNPDFLISKSWIRLLNFKHKLMNFAQNHIQSSLKPDDIQLKPKIGQHTYKIKLNHRFNESLSFG
ncbi:MAG TPA: hypothetical protein DCX89_05260 [Saprospirales bacterium]|nr:hypothetical protein [Saprospirales bacterium]HAY71279.1 hypothetical protein [Saprospirales bacterium]